MVMRFRTKEQLDDYLADKAREIKERLWFELVEEKGMTDMEEVARIMDLEVEGEVRRILDFAEIETSFEKTKHTKLELL